MFGRRLLAVVMILSLLVIGHPGGSNGVSANPSAECVQLAWYTGEMLAAGEQIDAEEATGPDMDHVEQWSAADFDQVLAFYDRIMITLQGIEPPTMAAQYHQTFLQGIELVQEMLVAMKTSGVVAIFAYLEPVARLNQQLADLSLPLETQCSVAMFDHDEDGKLEVGAGDAVATPAAGESELPGTPVASGSRDEPITPGTGAKLDDQWELTILSVTPDATDEVLAYDPSNTAPADGLQYFIARVKITNIGTEDGSFNDWRLTLEDSSDRSYAPFIDSCGFIEDELSTDMLAPGESSEGNVCWAIPSAEASSTAALVIYDGDAFESDRIYFSLDAPA